MLRNKLFATLLTLMLLCPQAAPLSAQTTPKLSTGRLTIGARGGATMSWMTFAPSDLVVRFEGDINGDVQLRDSRRFGGVGGVNVAYEVVNGWTLETGTLLATQGSTVQGTDELQLLDFPDDVVFATVTNTFRTKYVNVPVVVKASFGAPQGRFYLGAGPTFGFLVSATVSEEVRAHLRADDGSTAQATLVNETDIEDDMTSTTTSLTFLGGWEARGRRFRGFLEIGYDLGMTNLFSDESDLQDVKHRGFTFTAGAGF